MSLKSQTITKNYTQVMSYSNTSNSNIEIAGCEKKKYPMPKEGHIILLNRVAICIIVLFVL